MSLFTSRYTASLEQQVRDLKEQIAHEREQVTRLSRALINMSHGADKPQHPDKDKPEKKLPELGNWLRTKARLEDPRFQVSEAEQEN